MSSMIKEIDARGRIVLPVAWRKENGIRPRMKLVLIKEGHEITVQKYESFLLSKARK